MMAAMRWNRYTSDPLSEGNPSLAPAARFDLAAGKHRSATGTPRAQVPCLLGRCYGSPLTCVCACILVRRPRHSGGTDSKVADAASMRHLQSLVVFGPSADQLPPFNWQRWEGSSSAIGAACGGDTCKDLGPHVATEILAETSMPCEWRFAPTEVKP